MINGGSEPSEAATVSIGGKTQTKRPQKHPRTYRDARGRILEFIVIDIPVQSALGQSPGHSASNISVLLRHGNFGKAPGIQRLVEAEAASAHGRSTRCANRSAGARGVFVGQLTALAGLCDARSAAGRAKPTATLRRGLR